MDAWRQHLGQGQGLGSPAGTMEGVQAASPQLLEGTAARQDFPAEEGGSRGCTCSTGPGGGIAACTPTPPSTLDAVSSANFFEQGHLFSSQGDRLLGTSFHVPTEAPVDVKCAAKATLMWLSVSG